MITWHEQPNSFLCSATHGNGYSTYRFKVAFVGTDMGNGGTMDLDVFAQGGPSFSPFNWKSVYHLKVDGHVSGLDDILYMDPSKPGELPAVTPKADVSSAGWKTDSGVLVFPASGTYSAIHAVNAREAHVLYGQANGSKYCDCAVRISYYNGRPAYYYASGGSGPVPRSVWGKRYESLESACSGTLAELAGFVADRWTNIGSFRYSLTNRRPRKLTEHDVRFHVNHYTNSFRAACEVGFRGVKPQLHATAFDAIQKFDGNMLALLPEIGSFGRSTVESVLDYAGSSHGLKDAASLWLSQRYGDRLTKSDLSKLFGAIDRTFLTIQPKTCRFVRTKSRLTYPVTFGDWRGQSSSTVLACCQIASAPKDYNALMKLVRVAYEWDFYPSLGNVWDMIPLSFVVDWFVNVGDIWESVDRMVQSRYYDVPAVMMSYKATASLPSMAGVRATIYRRWLEQRLDLGVSSVELGLPSAINVVDGISLLLS